VSLFITAVAGSSFLHVVSSTILALRLPWQLPCTRYNLRVQSTESREYQPSTWHLSLLQCDIPDTRELCYDVATCHIFFLSYCILPGTLISSSLVFKISSGRLSCLDCQVALNQVGFASGPISALSDLGVHIWPDMPRPGCS
jgi:hypothetical protein